ncbi:inositol-3-phosphate synthase, partial [bacterium]|nr:inositol-3-phosphate synthase [bacterium]
IAIVGVGNCCSSLIQGLFYYHNVKNKREFIPGLMHNVLGGYKISDIKPVAAFDIDKRKVGKDLSQAIFEKPNCTKVFYSKIPNLRVKVKMGPVLDGTAPHMKDYPEDKTFVVAKEKPVDVVKELKKSRAKILINYCPVGSQKAVEFYANCALKTGVAFINAMPVFICSNKNWARKFEKRNLPIAGDDVCSQCGATILHKTLVKLLVDRGVKIDDSYQLNIGGNCDFLNMLDQLRLVSKRISKTEAIQKVIPYKIPLRIGPSDYVPHLKDNKICYININGRNFGDVPLSIDLKLSVEDSPNSAGVVIDVIRCCKLALDRKIGGPLISISAFAFKHPPVHMPYQKARREVEKFINGKNKR